MKAPRRYPDAPHRRFNPLAGRWVLREILGRGIEGAIGHQPGAVGQNQCACRLCPGNERTSGLRNPDYRGTFVFDNDFPALMPGRFAMHVDVLHQPDVLFRAEPEPGRCRVFCLSPRHDLSMAQMTQAENVVFRFVRQGRPAHALNLPGVQTQHGNRLASEPLPVVEQLAE